MSDTNRIPMQQGVRVKKEAESELAGKVGTSISRPADNRVEVDFGEGVKATFHQDELEVLS